jgi:hypothetical protein
MLLSSGLGLYMFNIPQRTPISTPPDASAITVTPFWSATYPDYNIHTPGVSPHVWNDTPRAQHDLCLSIFTRTGLHNFSPSRDPEKCAIVTHPISDDLFNQYPLRSSWQASGFRRVVWAGRSDDSAMIMINSCPYVTSSLEGCRGALRLRQRTDEALPQWNIGIPVEGWPSSLSWDEETGRICVLVEHDRRTSILVVNV